jgi:hypothetical protein
MTEEKKIIVDEDWKSQVEADREAARQRAEAVKPETAKPETTRPEAATSEKPSRETAGPMPPPSLQLLATSLGIQAMMAMGAMVNPVTNKAEANFERAKHYIDTIDMLLAKTAGNRTPDETESLEGLLHELRMGYLAMIERAKS